jgi:hydrogenase-4 membrane subunit HyfE
LLRPAYFWALTAVSALVLALVLVNVFLFRANTSIQQEINERQIYIQQSLQLEGLYRDMVRALAELAVQNKDERLRALLAAQGLTLTIKEPPTPAAPASRKK